MVLKVKQWYSLYIEWTIAYYSWDKWKFRRYAFSSNFSFILLNYFFTYYKQIETFFSGYEC